jgi:hypothetical protein
LEISHRTTVAARTEAIALRAETGLVEFKPRWRPSEDEILRAAITVIFVALVAIIALAAAATLTMGGQLKAKELASQWTIQCGWQEWEAAY